MFLDFALLTEQQGEMLDQIEYQVKAAGEYVEEGNVDIKKTIQYQKEIRKRYCCLIVLILVIVLVLMGVLGAFDQEETDKEDRRRLRDAWERKAVCGVLGRVDARARTRRIKTGFSAPHFCRAPHQVDTVTRRRVPGFFREVPVRTRTASSGP